MLQSQGELECVFEFVHERLAHCIYLYPFRILDALIEAAEIWKTWGDITILERHRIIANFLWMCLRACSIYSRAKSWLQTDSPDYPLDMLRKLDIAALGAFLVQVLERDENCFASYSSNNAQDLVDLLQGVRQQHHSII